MSPLLLPASLFGSGDRERFLGVCVALVTNNQDPQGRGRVKVKFPWLGEDDESTWIRIASPMAGNGRGMYFLPEVDDEVLVAFEHGAGDAILDRAGRIARLELGPQTHAGLGAQALELDQGRVPDCLDDVAVPPPAGLVLEALSGHCFRKCS